MITGKIIEKLPRSLRKKIENNHELRNIIGNINWLTLENIFRSVIGMFVYGWVAQYLGPRDFGLMNYSLAFVSLFAALSALGMDDIVIRDLVSNPKRKQELLGSALVLKLLGSLLMIIISGVAIFIVEKDSQMLRSFVLILAFGYVFKSFDVIDLWFKSQVKSQFSVYARSFSFLIISFIKIILIKTNAPLIAFVSMYSVDFLLIAVFLIIFYKRRNREEPFQWRIDKKIINKLLIDSFPLMLASFTMTIQSEIDQVLLKNMISAEELGIYSSALKIVVSVSFVCSIIRSSFFPSIISAKNKEKGLYDKKLMQLYQLMMVTFLLIAIPAVIFKDPIVNILYGKEYSAAANLLPLVMSRLFFTHYSTARSTFLLNENLTKYSFVTTLIATVINICLNYYLIPKYQAVGAIISSSISLFINIFLIDLLNPKTRKNAFLMFKSTLNFYKLFS